MRAELIENILREFTSASGDIEGVVATSLDGLPVASFLPQGAEEDRVSAMAAAMLSLGGRTAEELRRGELEQVLIRGREGFVLMVQAGQEAVLTALIRQSAKLGLVFLDIKRAAERIAQML